MSRPVQTTLSVIEAKIGPLEGRSILDVGCGRGALARVLAKRGVRVAGIDPQKEAVEAAQAAVPEGDFRTAGAEQLPFEAGAFDAAVILNALHHVPQPLMAAALREAARVSAGPLLVIEPLAEGSFFAAIKPVDDETEIRAEAQAAIAAAVEAGELKLLEMVEYDDRRPFPSVAAFLAKVVEVDPARAAVAEREADHVASIIAEVGEATESGFVLMQPHRAHLLARA
ncbi:class I SAM-dependent methyltransferase [Xanthobacteraceae bacterium A53D]